MMVGTIFIVKIFLYVFIFMILFSLQHFLVGVYPNMVKSIITPRNIGLEYENISFKTSDNVVLHGWFIEAKGAQGTIIIGHGYPMDKGNVLPVTAFLYPKYNLFYYDHRYFGESGGKITTVGIKETKDVEAAVAFVRERFGDEYPIGLYGFSLSASSMLMANVSIDAVVTDSPYADLERMIKHIYFYLGPLKWPFVKLTELFAFAVFRVHPKDISAVVAVKDSKIPIFLIHGEQDSQIPVENAYAIKASNPSIELWIVPGADHGQAHAVAKEEYEMRIKSFFKKHIK